MAAGKSGKILQKSKKTKPIKVSPRSKQFIDGPLTDRQLLSWHTTTVFNNFCRTHNVQFVADYTSLGTPKKTKHGCRIHLPLPLLIQEKIGYRRLVRRGEVKAKKVDAFREAAKECLLALQAEAGVDLHALLQPPPKRTLSESELYTLAEDKFDQSNLPEVLRQGMDQNIPAMLLQCALLLEKMPKFERHPPVLSKTGGLIIQCNAKFQALDQAATLIQARGFEHADDTYEKLELELLKEVSKRLSKQTQPALLAECNRIGRKIYGSNVSAVATKSHAELIVRPSTIIDLSLPAQRAFADLHALLSRKLDQLAAAGRRAVQRFDVNASDHLRRRRAVETQLPIVALRDALLNELARSGSRVALVEGGTGSGKTTQVPQFLLDAPDDAGPPRRIIVAQPRRIAAIASANRVAFERGEALGDSVGYAVHLDRVAPTARDTVEFVTAGILLRRLMNTFGADSRLDGITHIIVDEAHERDAQIDLLLAQLRRIHRRARGLPTGRAAEAAEEAGAERPSETFRVDAVAGATAAPHMIVMSATLESDSLQRYFELEDAALFRVPAATNFAVKTHWLEDLPRLFPRTDALARAVDFVVMRESKEAEAVGVFNLENKTIDAITQVAADTVNALLAEARNEPRGSSRGAILCFLPGWAEIEMVANKVFRNNSAADVAVHKLHSSVSLPQQRAALQRAPSGKTKVVLATSIAETSLTFDDATVVIDAGLSRVMRYSTASQISALVTEPICRSSARQRLGRVGRVAPGTCYRLYTEAHHGARMREHVEPEIQRSNLESMLLDAKALVPPGESAEDLLAETLDPPPLQAIQAARQRLYDLGAFADATSWLRAAPGGSAAVAAAAAGGSSEVLTDLGAILSRLPLDPCLGRAVVLGLCLGEPDAASSLAAILTVPRAIERLAEAAHFRPHEEQPNSDVAVALGVFEDIEAHPRKNWTSDLTRIANEVRKLKNDIDTRVRNEIRASKRDVLLGLQAKLPEKVVVKPPERLASTKVGDGYTYRNKADQAAAVAQLKLEQDIAGRNLLFGRPEPKPTEEDDDSEQGEEESEEDSDSSEADFEPQNYSADDDEPELASTKAPEPEFVFDARQHRAAVVAAVTCAAMSSHVAFSRGSVRARSTIMTRSVNQVRIDNRSKNFNFLAASAAGSWLVYAEMVESSRAEGAPMLRHTSRITPLQLVLFGGDHFIPVSQSLKASVLDSWIVVRSFTKDALPALTAVEETRNALGMLLEQTAAPTDDSLPTSAREFLATLKATLQMDSRHLEKVISHSGEDKRETGDFKTVMTKLNFNSSMHKDDKGSYEVTLSKDSPRLHYKGKDNWDPTTGDARQKANQPREKLVNAPPQSRMQQPSRDFSNWD